MLQKVDQHDRCGDKGGEKGAGMENDVGASTHLGAEGERGVLQHPVGDFTKTRAGIGAARHAIDDVDFAVDARDVHHDIVGARLDINEPGIAFVGNAGFDLDIQPGRAKAIPDAIELGQILVLPWHLGRQRGRVGLATSEGKNGCRHDAIRSQALRG
ncbi:hypothetical protein [Aureimonas ureilytica]|uniref:hypothetical protein n=1 Tax=Aureimonas ureilytica TaxID=401562 RepID=UPI00187C4BC9|nr:hypothetical protein [Aureimonas ureilytica]